MLKIKWPALCVGVCIVLVGGVILGYGWASGKSSKTIHVMPQKRQVLYWYDPMAPDQKFQKPGKSPFMDMELVPKYADESVDAGTITIDPRVVQNLGMRTAAVKRSVVEDRVDATGMLVFNARDVVILQSRSAGFVERVARLAPGDMISKGDVIADILVPEWIALQQEFLSVNLLGDEPLRAAGRQRLRIAGMPTELIQQIEKTRRLQTHIQLKAPQSGVIQELGVRKGMTVTMGQFIARIQGIDTVWLEVAIPEAQANRIHLGQLAQAHFSAFPEQTIEGKVTSIVPELNAMTRTLRVRVELPNSHHQLLPGLSAQVILKNSSKKTALVVPTESVIRTGQRSLVIVAEDQGHYRPVEIIIGQEMGDNTVIAQGLEESQRVVTSGQFLIDSEASLKGITTNMGEE